MGMHRSPDVLSSLPLQDSLPYCKAAIKASISATEVTEVPETTKGEAKSMETTDGHGLTRIKEKH